MKWGSGVGDIGQLVFVEKEIVQPLFVKSFGRYMVNDAFESVLCDLVFRCNYQVPELNGFMDKLLQRLNFKQSIR